MALPRKRKTETPFRQIKVGKELDALFGELPELNAGQNQSEQTIAITKIDLPDQQPRRYFDPQAMQALRDSIQRDGILEPLLLREKDGDRYELVAGERRYRAAKEAGLESVPAIIRQLTTEQALHITLIENLLREDLNPLEETEGILQLLALRLNLSPEEITTLLYRMQNDVQRLTHNVMGQPEADLIQTVFAEVGVAWESFINNRLPLLKLPNDILTALREGQLAYTKAQAIAKVKDTPQRKKLLKQALSKDLSLSEIREQVIQLQATTQPEGDDLPSFRIRMDDVCRRVKKAQVWDDPKKRRKLEKAIADLEALLEG
jgi:ParB family transcriptional regulator, chromosome partitioning protein